MFQVGRSKLVDMVENRTVYTLGKAELNVYETHRKAENVPLGFGDPLLVSMIKGKKVMNLSNLPHFAFLPGESVVLPSNERMEIDFPDASLHNPTQCLALAISPEIVQKTAELLNAHGQRMDQTDWNALGFNYRFMNDKAVNQIIQRLIFVFTENHPSKDVFSELLLQELLIRILQMENLQRYESREGGDALTHVLRFIKENLQEDLSIKVLSRQACMSESKFYKAFRLETGLTPNEYIIEERLKRAEHLLLQEDSTVKEVYMACGFSSFSYFSTLFKKRRNASPTSFKKRSQM